MPQWPLIKGDDQWLIEGVAGRVPHRAAGRAAEPRQPSVGWPP